MRKFFPVLLGVVLALSFLPACSDDCEPTLVDPDEVIYLNILRTGGQSLIKYSGNALPGDSVRVTNLANGSAVSRYLVRDSILAIENYDKTANAVNNYKIEVGAAGYRKPDTLQVVTNRLVIIDNCGREIERARFKTLKVNNATRCTDCAYNQVYAIQKTY